MATAVRKHKIMNPARRRKNKARRRLSAKQIRAGFGGKRRKSAAKVKRHNKAPRLVKRVNRAHRPKAKRSHRNVARPRVAKRRKNPGESILSLTLDNPGGRRGMATKRKNRKHHHRKSHPKARRRNPSMKMRNRHVRRHHRRNAGGGGNIIGLLTSGVFAAGGLVLSRFATQAVLGAQNMGFMGYAGNAVATAALAWATHIVSKNPRNRDAVILGGVMGIIARLITDYTPYGSFLQSQGFGDYGMGLYLPQNDPMPSRLVAPNGAIVEVPGGWGGGFVAAPAAAGMGDLYTSNSGGLY